MKKSETSFLITELIMIVLLIINFFISNVFNVFMYSTFLLIPLLFYIGSYGFNRSKNIYQKRVLRNIAIVITAYFLITYLLGLIIGFNRSIYRSFSVANFRYNLLPLILIGVISELLRFQFIDKSNKSKKVAVFSCILFIVFTASMNYKEYNFEDTNQLFYYIGYMVLGNISKNIFLTIQCYNTGYRNNIIYRLIMEGYIYIIPLTPALGPYVSTVMEIFIPVICSFVVFNSVKREKLEKPVQFDKKNYVAGILFITVIIVVMSNSGFFKIQNLTIGSNSMKPYMAKGDVIIIEKMKGKELEELKKGDILVFRYDAKIISHRIKNIINRDNQLFFVTKGDNNDQQDNNLVKEDDVIGIVRYRIKYIGLPSIWVQEMFS